MKKMFFIILIFISFNCFSQTQEKKEVIYHAPASAQEAPQIVQPPDIDISKKTQEVYRAATSAADKPTLVQIPGADSTKSNKAIQQRSLQHSADVKQESKQKK